MRDKINDDLKTAMKAGDKDRVGTLRLINSAIKSADIDARPPARTRSPTPTSSRSWPR